MVSRGLSQRLRVGFDRSGSAIGFPWLSRCCIARIDANDDFTPLATAEGSSSCIAIDGSALELRRRDCFSSCVSWRSILCPLPLLLCEWKLKLDFAHGRPSVCPGLCCSKCWPGGAGNGWFADILFQNTGYDRRIGCGSLIAVMMVMSVILN